MITYSSNPDSYLNRARRLLFEGKQEWANANRGQGSRSKANRMMSEARIQLKQVLYGKKPGIRYTPDHDITIAGIPCGVVLTYYNAPRCNNWGHPDDREPDDPAEVDFFIVDRKGYVAEWLMDKERYELLRQRVIDLIEGEPK